MSESTHENDLAEDEAAQLEPIVMLPCPFCGGTDIDASFSRGYETGDISKPMIAAGCMDCSCTGPDIVLPNNGPGYRESIAAWNKRAT